ncbi:MULTISPECIES: hypothetical protein [unclassified Nocardioides]|jgi:hypothetical protein|uniref:hypothetical protein n=1 Tax=unclassified Nocardioides TaxID=2615069 RepID=UPI0009F11E3F|nr:MULTISPECIES: hypothetical protein [unclassified Nocardioides]GAW50999.1 uncharacterized protein PD653B2_3335 [Nocardioides sp. PD653-B2]
MSKSLPAELELRCQQILSADQQGVALTKADYFWFLVVTVVVPAILIAVGVAL